MQLFLAKRSVFIAGWFSSVKCGHWPPSDKLKCSLMPRIIHIRAYNFTYRLGKRPVINYSSINSVSDLVIFFSVNITFTGRIEL